MDFPSAHAHSCFSLFGTASPLASNEREREWLASSLSLSLPLLFSPHFESVLPFSQCLVSPYHCQVLLLLLLLQHNGRCTPFRLPRVALLALLCKRAWLGLATAVVTRLSCVRASWLAGLLAGRPRHCICSLSLSGSLFFSKLHQAKPSQAKPNQYQGAEDRERGNC